MDRICIVVPVLFQLVFTGSACMLNLHGNQEQNIKQSDIPPRLLSRLGTVEDISWRHLHARLADVIKVRQEREKVTHTHIKLWNECVLLLYTPAHLINAFRYCTLCLFIWREFAPREIHSKLTNTDFAKAWADSSLQAHREIKNNSEVYLVQ